MCFTLPSLSMMIRTGTGLNLCSVKTGINPRDHVFVTGVILDAHRESAPARPCRGIGFRGQLHLIHIRDQVLQQFGVAAG